MIDAVDKEFLEKQGYSHVRKLDTGEWAGIRPMMFTTALCVGLHRIGYEIRFCYDKATEAAHALANWDGRGWPPGYWIKAKGGKDGDVRYEDVFGKPEAPF